MSSIVLSYLAAHDFYTKTYGQKTIVLFRIDSFYECYCTNTRGPNIYDICQLLNIGMARRNALNGDISESNPYMTGFPFALLEKFIDLFINNGFTVVVKEQYDSDILIHSSHVF